MVESTCSRFYHMTANFTVVGIKPSSAPAAMVKRKTKAMGQLWVYEFRVKTNDRDALASRLLAIHDGLMRILDEFRPDEAAVETTFVNKDAAATLKLGQARGIAMVVPAKAGVPVAEYAPNLVKKTIVGAGHGDKAQIRMMIGVLLPKADPKSHDAADALAVAMTHAHHAGELPQR